MYVTENERRNNVLLLDCLSSLRVIKRLSDVLFCDIQHRERGLVLIQIVTCNTTLVDLIVIQVIMFTNDFITVSRV